MKHLFITFLFSLSLLTTFTPTVGLAQDATTNDQNIGAETQFVPLVGIPFMDMGADLNLDNYVNNLYRAAITIAALLAVIRIIFAGFQYMLSDIVTQKTDARKSIKNALLGLLIVIGAVLILETINPNLIRVPILGGEGGLQGFIGDLGAVPVGVTVPKTDVDISFIDCPDGQTGGKVSGSDEPVCIDSTLGDRLGNNLSSEDIFTSDVSGILQSSPQLQNIDPTSIVGVLNVNFGTAEGIEILNKVDLDLGQESIYKERYMVPACKKQGGLQVVEVELQTSTAYVCKK